MAQIDKSTIALTNPSDRTIAERNKFAALVDDFATFKWNGIDMFNEFGAFIINEKKGSLQIYNGPSFKNTYSQQQYQDGYSNLTGITFNTQQISFTIGVYWISIEDYRVLINTLHPYEVGMLSFSFEKTYGYQCKLANIKDSARHVVGNEKIINTTENNGKLNYSKLTSGNSGGYRYYTELQLTFDVIGKQCAKEIAEYKDKKDTNIFSYNSISNYAESVFDKNDNWHWPSDLNYPVKLSFDGFSSLVSNPELKATAFFTDDYNNTSEALLFHIKFKNLIARPRNLENLNESYTQLTFKYDSEQGLIYIEMGNKEQILSLLSINADGKRFVEYLEVNRFYWPGRLENAEVNTDNTCKIVITDISSYTTEEAKIDANNIIYSARRRTNVI